MKAPVLDAVGRGIIDSASSWTRLFAGRRSILPPMTWLHCFAKWINTERLNILLAALNILLAALTLFMAWVAFKLSRRTLTYMKERDFELDTRNGWIEIHKAMVNLRTLGALVRFPSSLGSYSQSMGHADAVVENYTLARSQLLGQLDRLNDDPLLDQISEFLKANLLTQDWQTDRFEKRFDTFAQQVALKSRPK